MLALVHPSNPKAYTKITLKCQIVAVGKAILI